MAQSRRSVSDLYPSPWLKAEDLRGHSARVQISEAAVEEVRQRDGTSQAKIILSFMGKTKRLILNKTQAVAMVSITGSEYYDDWPGSVVMLSPARAPNGQNTIAITRIPAEEGRA